MGGAHRRDHADTAHNLLKMCVSLLHSFLILIAWTDGASLFYTTPQPTTLNVLRQYALHVLFVPPAPSPDGAFDSTAAPVRNPFPFIRQQAEYSRPRPHRRASRLGQLGKDRGVARRLRRESVGRSMGARSVVRRRNRLGQRRRRAKNVRGPRGGPRSQSTHLPLSSFTPEH